MSRFKRITTWLLICGFAMVAVFPEATILDDVAEVEGHFPRGRKFSAVMGTCFNSSAATATRSPNSEEDARRRDRIKKEPFT